jgi:hypothetical protein
MTKLTLDDYDKLQVHKDGNAFFVCTPDFVDLQESDVVWYEKDSPGGKTLTEWYGFSSNPIIHLPILEVAYIIKKLNQRG